MVHLPFNRESLMFLFIYLIHESRTTRVHFATSNQINWLDAEAAAAAERVPVASLYNLTACLWSTKKAAIRAKWMNHTEILYSHRRARNCYKIKLMPLYKHWLCVVSSSSYSTLLYTIHRDDDDDDMMIIALDKQTARHHLNSIQ